MLHTFVKMINWANLIRVFVNINRGIFILFGAMGSVRH